MISVIITVYNGEKYIKQAIQSILNQSCKDYEIIIVDDGSTDNTYRELEKYIDKIKYYYKENAGVASARNYGIIRSKGDYICFLDADDLYKESKLENQIKFLKENPNIDIVYNDVDVIDKDSNYINTLRSEGIYSNREDFLAMMLVRQVIPGPASIMLRRKCIEDNILYNEMYKNTEDYDFTLKLAQKFTYGYIPERLYMYRRHTNNLTNNHKVQSNNEAEITKKLGLENINSIISKSSFNEEQQRMILAKVLIKIGELEKAKNVLLGILKIKESGLVYFYLGNCCYNILDYKSAKGYYEKSLLFDNSLAEAYNNLGCVNVKLDDFRKAKSNFVKALNVRNEYMDAKLNLENLNVSNSECKITEKELRKTLTMYK